MTGLTNAALQQDAMRAGLSALGERVPLRHLLRKDVALGGPAWLPLVLVLGAIAAVAYADHFVSSISLVYLYILPLSVGAIFLRRAISYSLIVACILFHDYYSPRNINLGIRIFHNLSAILCFAFVVYLIQRYMAQREALAKTVQQQRDDLLEDVKLAGQVQRLFLPSGKPMIAGLDIAGMMLPLRGVGGDYYDYIPIDAHTTQVAIADVAGKGVPAALLMAATAAGLRLEANHDRNMLQQVERLNAEIGAVSDPERYVTLLVAEFDTQKRARSRAWSRLAHQLGYRPTRFANWRPLTLAAAMCWSSTPMESQRQRTGLAKNLATSAFPRSCAMVLRSRRKS